MRISFREAVKLAGVEPGIIYQMISAGRLSRGQDKYITIDIQELKACFPHIQIDEFVTSRKDDPFESAEREWKESRRQYEESVDACDARVFELYEMLQAHADSMAKRGVEVRFVDGAAIREFDGKIHARSTVIVVVTFPRVFDSYPILPIAFEGYDHKFHLVNDDTLCRPMERITSQLGYELGSTAEECIDLIAKFRVSLEPKLAAAREAAVERERSAAAAAVAQREAYLNSLRLEKKTHQSGVVVTAGALACFVAVILFFDALPEHQIGGFWRVIRALVILLGVGVGIFAVPGMCIAIIVHLFKISRISAKESDARNNSG